MFCRLGSDSVAALGAAPLGAAGSAAGASCTGGSSCAFKVELESNHPRPDVTNSNSPQTNSFQFIRRNAFIDLTMREVRRSSRAHALYSAVAQMLPAYRSRNVLRAATARSDLLTSVHSLLR